MTDQIDIQFIPVATPVELVGDIYDRIARYLREEKATRVAVQDEVHRPEASVETDRIDREFTQDEWNRIRAEYDRPFPLLMIEMMAARPGEWVPYAEMMEHGNVDSPSAANAKLGSFTRWMKKNLGRQHWPFEYAVPVGLESGHYRMSATNAARWQRSQ